MLVIKKNSILIRAIFLALVFYIANTFFYMWIIGDFSSTGFLESSNAWNDHKYYINLIDSDQPWFSFVKGGTFYPNLMYRAFPGTMMPSIVINSLLFGLAFSILCAEKKKYTALYILGCLPVICYFSIGFTKEAPVILGLALLNYHILRSDKYWGVFSFLLMLFVKPVFAFIALPGYFKWSQRNIKVLLVAALALTPIYFWIIKALYFDNYYYERYFNFENSIRSSYPIISIIGNLIAIIKVYLEAILIAENQSVDNIQSDILIYFFYITNFIFIINFRNLLQPRNYIFLLMSFFLSMGPISHFRYLMPILLIVNYIVLPDGVKVHNFKAIAKV